MLDYLKTARSSLSSFVDRNPLVLLLISAGYLSQTTYWAYVVAMPGNVSFLVDSEFQANYYAVLVRSAVFSFAGAFVGSVILEVIFRALPKKVLQLKFFRSIRASFVQQVSGFDFRLFAAIIALGLTMTGVKNMILLLSSLFTVLLIWKLLIRFQLFMLRRKHLKDKRFAIQMISSLKLDDPHIGTNRSKETVDQAKKFTTEIRRELAIERLHKRYNEKTRPVLIFGFATGVALLLGVLHAAHIGDGPPNARFGDPMQAGILVGRSSDYYFLFRGDNEDLLLIPRGEIGVSFDIDAGN